MDDRIAEIEERLDAPYMPIPIFNPDGCLWPGTLDVDIVLSPSAWPMEERD